MTTKITGASRMYLKKSHRRSLRKYKRYRKKVVVPAKAGSQASPGSAAKE